MENNLWTKLRNRYVLWYIRKRNEIDENLGLWGDLTFRTAYMATPWENLPL